MIYLDHNATTPLDPEVAEAMQRAWRDGGNPESRHAAGRAARRSLDRSRETVGRILHAHPDEVVFTSGGTESNNLALFGLIGPDGGVGSHIVGTPIEHPAVAEPLLWLERSGVEVDRVPVTPDGRADPARMADAIRPGATRLATLISAHNETGVIQPVAELAGRAAGLGVPVHTDAVQAVGRIPVDFQALGVSTLAASGHKFHGPGGVGLLLVRRGVKLAPRLFGGGQQGGVRPGTPAVALAVGLATALGRWDAEQAERICRWTTLRDRLEAGLLAGLGPDRVIRTGPDDPALRLPQTLHVGFPGLDGDALLMQLDLAGVAASLGSACASGATEPSPTLVAMGIPADRLRSSVRFSLGAPTTERDIDTTIERVVAIVNRISARHT